MAAPVLLTSGPAMCEAALHPSGTNLVCLFYIIATLFQLYPGGDIVYEMIRKKAMPTPLPTQRILISDTI